MTTRDWLGRRLPLWTLVTVGVVLLGVAALLLLLNNSMLDFLVISPLTIVGLYTLASPAGNGDDEATSTAAGSRSSSDRLLRCHRTLSAMCSA